MISRLALILTAGVLGLVGCRGQTVSTSEFLARGNAVCADAADRIRDLADPRARQDTTPAQYAGYVDDYVAELRLELTNLRAVGYPAGRRAGLERDYQHLDAQLTAAERHPLEFDPRTLAPAELALHRAGLSACRP
jgi:hypothetical protein